MSVQYVYKAEMNFPCEELSPERFIKAINETYADNGWELFDGFKLEPIDLNETIVVLSTTVVDFLIDVLDSTAHLSTDQVILAEILDEAIEDGDHDLGGYLIFYMSEDEPTYSEFD